jgi:hypothetical protein
MKYRHVEPGSEERCAAYRFEGGSSQKTVVDPRTSFTGAVINDVNGSGCWVLYHCKMWDVVATTRCWKIARNLFDETSRELIADNLAVEWKYSRLFPQALNCASSAFLADALLWFLQFLSLLDCITLCVCPSCDFGRKSRSLGKLYERQDYERTGHCMHPRFLCSFTHENVPSNDVRSRFF